MQILLHFLLEFNRFFQFGHVLRLVLCYFFFGFFLDLLHAGFVLLQFLRLLNLIIVLHFDDFQFVFKLFQILLLVDLLVVIVKVLVLILPLFLHFGLATFELLHNVLDLLSQGLLNGVVCIELFDFLRGLLDHEEVLLDQVLHIDEALDDLLEGIG